MASWSPRTSMCGRDSKPRSMPRAAAERVSVGDALRWRRRASPPVRRPQAANLLRIAARQGQQLLGHVNRTLHRLAEPVSGLAPRDVIRGAVEQL